jgi:type III secretion system-like peptide-binding chaperone
MGIFRRNQSKDQETITKLEESARTVEQILANIGVDPVSARMQVQAGYGWNFQRGSALIEVYVTQEERGYLQVLSPILHLPQTNLLALYRRLLELNLQLTNASVGVHQDVVYVFNERPLDGLDPIEADSIIRKLAIYADELDNSLVEEFGGRMYGQG